MPADIHLDGRLDEDAWQIATPITDFVQAEPNEGAPPSDPMEIRILYDDTALWIGARMRRSQDVSLQAPMSRRDEGDQAEYLQIELDTYLDRRTAYMFGVTASGVRLDHFHPTDNETDIDPQFDPVWQARTAADANGWTAEMWLPFSQLRFNDQPERIWGLNIKRWRPELNEQDYWIVIGRTERGGPRGSAICAASTACSRGSGSNCCRTSRARRSAATNAIRTTRSTSARTSPGAWAPT